MVIFKLFYSIQSYALKLLEITTGKDDEIDFLRKLNCHDHIVKYIDDFIDKGFQCIITEFCDVYIYDKCYVLFKIF